MKKLVCLLLLIVSVTILAGCENRQIEADKSKLVGEWSLIQSYGYVGYSLIEAWQERSAYYGYVFRDDGRFWYDYIHTANSILPTGTYTLDGTGRVRITISGSTRTYTYSFNRDTLVLSDLSPKTSAFWKYKLVR